MGTFSKLFGSLLALVYHCFDRVVIQGYLPLLTREEHIVHFFRDVHKIYPITKDALRHRTRYTHYYFYIRDVVLGPLIVCVGSFLPFQTTYYLNGHHFIEGELRRQGVRFRKDDNAFLWVSDQKALQAAADGLSASIIRRRLEYWTSIVGPKFSKEDRRAICLRRDYSLNQIEYARNFVFRRHFPIHRFFERSCELGVFRLSADQITQIFGFRKHKRLRGKFHSMLEKVDHGHHVLRVYCKDLVARLYEKFSTFLRVEICVNRMKDLGLNKGLDQLDTLRRKLIAATDRMAGFEDELLNVHVEFPLFQRLALPVTSGKTKIAGIKIHDTRMMRLMEVLLHGGTQLNGWRSADIHQAILASFGLSPDSYTVTQLRYDLRKMKAHGLLERNRKRYLYHSRYCEPG